MTDINTAVRFVDAWLDDDPKTTNSSPGTVDGHKLILIGLQKQRRIFGRGKTKHVIFLEEGTRNIWYKKNFDYPSIVKMGFSISEMRLDQKALPMETYAKIFIDGKKTPDHLIGEIGTSARNWLKRNDFELI